MAKLKNIQIQAEYETDLLSTLPCAEHRLLGAVLARAIADLSSDDRNKVKSSLHWFYTDNPGGEGFTYNQVMEALNFRPSQIDLIKKRILKAYHDDELLRERKVCRKEASELVKRQRLSFRS